MELFSKTRVQERFFSHGGVRVLRLTLLTPTGESPAERHVRAVEQGLVDFVEREVLPAWIARLEEAVRAGRSFAFRAGQCDIRFAVHTRARSVAVDVIFDCDEGDERSMRMFWTRDGKWQRPLSRHGLAKKALARAKFL